MICRDILSQLNETIPDIVDLRRAGFLVKENVAVLEILSDSDLVGMKEMNGVHCNILKFYTHFVHRSFYLHQC